MTVHLLRPAVGVRDLDHLRQVMRERGDERSIYTRTIPKRVEELLDGGSVYWIISRRILARQRLTSIRKLEDDEGRPFARIFVDGQVVPVEPWPRRPHQGWRYLKPEEAPPDLREGDTGDMPPEMVAELKDLGLL
ncbi:MAG: DUF1489 family protein [Alphaproteobacteria bacterium]|nr:DUF1489 family protein [Alphaproteobacteria bacterium]